MGARGQLYPGKSEWADQPGEDVRGEISPDLSAVTTVAELIPVIELMISRDNTLLRDLQEWRALKRLPMTAPVIVAPAEDAVASSINPTIQWSRITVDAGNGTYRYSVALEYDGESIPLDNATNLNATSYVIDPTSGDWLAPHTTPYTVTVTVTRPSDGETLTSAVREFYVTIASVSGAVLALNADALGGADNSLVATWGTAAQADTDKQGTLKHNIINGRKVVRFGANDGMNTPSVNLTGTNAVTIYAVFSAPSGSNRMIVEFSANTNTAANLGFSLLRDTNNKAYAVHQGAVNYSDYATTGTITTVPSLVSAVLNKGLSTNEVTAWLNSISGGTRSLNGNNTDNYGNQPFYIGARNNASAFLAGDIALVYVFSSAHSTTLRQQIEAYINELYNLYTDITISEYSDTAYAAVLNRSDTGTFIQTSSAARAIFDTTADTAFVETYNDKYTLAPGSIDVGVRVDGVDLTAVEPGGLGTKTNTVSLGSTSAKRVDFINGSQSKPVADRLGAYVTRIIFNRPAVQVFPTPTPRILVYGDSIAVGANATNPSLQGVWQLVRNAYSGSVLLEAWGYRSLHDDAADSAARLAFAAHIAAQAPTIIWLAIGTNDYGLNKWSAASFGAAYADLLDKLHAALPAVPIYAQTPLVRTTETANGSGSTLGNYRTQIATAAAARSSYCTLVDGTTILTPGDLDDGLHPTTAGEIIYSASVRATLGI